jgi:hypothetical protein
MFSCRLGIAEAGITDLGRRSNSPRPLRKMSARLTAPLTNLPRDKGRRRFNPLGLYGRWISLSFLDEIDAEIRQAGSDQAVASGNKPPIFAWLITAFSFQDISDRVARSYIAKHGPVSWPRMEASLQTSPLPEAPNLLGLRGFQVRQGQIYLCRARSYRHLPGTSSTPPEWAAESKRLSTWAGKYRTVRTSKGGNPFAYARLTGAPFRYSAKRPISA